MDMSLQQFSVGDMVKFKWWSSYIGQSTTVDKDGHIVWNTVYPNDTGVVVNFTKQGTEDYVIVLFSRMNILMKVHSSMLELMQA